MLIVKGGGRVTLKSDELLKRYPEIEENEIDLTLSILSDKDAEINVMFENMDKVTEDEVKLVQHIISSKPTQIQKASKV